jgi:hypothetical protein
LLPVCQSGAHLNPLAGAKQKMRPYGKKNFINREVKEVE